MFCIERLHVTLVQNEPLIYFCIFFVIRNIAVTAIFLITNTAVISKVHCSRRKEEEKKTKVGHEASTVIQQWC